MFINPVTKGIVGIEDSTENEPSNASCLVDLEKRKQYDWHCETHNYPESYSIIDFKDKIIIGRIFIKRSFFII